MIIATRVLNEQQHLNFPAVSAVCTAYVALTRESGSVEVRPREGDGRPNERDVSVTLFALCLADHRNRGQS
jgi:hypothetical protein